ncbi:MAG: MATE family efflux transporter, partial [Clostridium fessum]
LNNILMSFANIILNQALVGYGDTPVAAMGVAMKSNMLVVLLQIGLCVGIQPLIGYNYGARNKKRLMSVFKFTGLVSIIMGTILTLFMIVARKTMIQMFINDAEVVQYGIQMVVALQLSAPFLGILFLHQYDPGNGKSASVADSYDLPPGTDFYSADFRAECDVWPGWSYLCTAGG